MELVLAQELKGKKVFFITDQRNLEIDAAQSEALTLIDFSIMSQEQE